MNNINVESQIVDTTSQAPSFTHWNSSNCYEVIYAIDHTYGLCKICNFTSDNPSEIAEHSNNHLYGPMRFYLPKDNIKVEDDTFSCTLCNFETESNSEMLGHQNTHMIVELKKTMSLLEYKDSDAKLLKMRKFKRNVQRMVNKQTTEEDLKKKDKVNTTEDSPKKKYKVKITKGSLKDKVKIVTNLKDKTLTTKEILKKNGKKTIKAITVADKRETLKELLKQQMEMFDKSLDDIIETMEKSSEYDIGLTENSLK